MGFLARQMRLIEIYHRIYDLTIYDLLNDLDKKDDDTEDDDSDSERFAAGDLFFKDKPTERRDEEITETLDDTQFFELQAMMHTTYICNHRSEHECIAGNDPSVDILPPPRRVAFASPLFEQHLRARCGKHHKYDE
jgi:hypothetical protein